MHEENFAKIDEEDNLGLKLYEECFLKIEENPKMQV